MHAGGRLLLPRAFVQWGFVMGLERPAYECTDAITGLKVNKKKKKAAAAGGEAAAGEDP